MVNQDAHLLINLSFLKIKSTFLQTFILILKISASQKRIVLSIIMNMFLLAKKMNQDQPHFLVVLLKLQSLCMKTHETESIPNAYLLGMMKINKTPFLESYHLGDP